MPYIIRVTITTFTLLFLATIVLAQEAVVSKKELQENRSTYRGISYAGFGYGSFRDFATSPLTYSGISIVSGGFKISIDQKRETESGVPFSAGIYRIDFNNHSSSSTIFTLSPYYSELYLLKGLSSKKRNVKVGGMLQATLNLRTNADLMNNGLGLEIIPTLFGSIKGTWNVSRVIDKDRKFLFFVYKQLKRRKSLSFRLNLGLINASYRNGFAYSGQSFLLNNPQAFDNYKFKVFSGFRMSSSLDYTLYSRKTTNAIQLSYVWDAFKTGGDLDIFEMAQHGLRFTLLFNTK